MPYSEVEEEEEEEEEEEIILKVSGRKAQAIVLQNHDLIISTAFSDEDPRLLSCSKSVAGQLMQ